MRANWGQRQHMQTRGHHQPVCTPKYIESIASRVRQVQVQGAGQGGLHCPRGAFSTPKPRLQAHQQKKIFFLDQLRSANRLACLAMPLPPPHPPQPHTTWTPRSALSRKASTANRLPVFVVQPPPPRPPSEPQFVSVAEERTVECRQYVIMLLSLIQSSHTVLCHSQWTLAGMHHTSALSVAV